MQGWRREEEGRREKWTLMGMELGKRVGVEGLWRREGKDGGEEGGDGDERVVVEEERRRRAGSGVGVREVLLSPGVLHVMPALAIASALLFGSC